MILMSTRAVSTIPVSMRCSDDFGVDALYRRAELMRCIDDSIDDCGVDVLGALYRRLWCRCARCAVSTTVVSMCSMRCIDDCGVDALYRRLWCRCAVSTIVVSMRCIHDCGVDALYRRAESCYQAYFQCLFMAIEKIPSLQLSVSSGARAAMAFTDAGHSRDEGVWNLWMMRTGKA
ncbi:hypothetical protein CBR_g37696 [Chara braunii]|uniref:Uncharacterized protein n=1 Tax=Chara braunii TaxID=69332 RepID=A0A388JZX1_CHABU|nr:hypothetical protein CBR_g37696 [Chara braunii]|eukprot:GBG63338.1 hypothetical protein CBR_g37696 [Chara braunii]